MAELFATTIFVLGYIAIAFEHRLFVNKAAASLVLGVMLWVVVSFAIPLEKVEYFLSHVSVDIFGLVVFLITAMTLIEILIHYHFFDAIERWLRKRSWTQRQLGWALVAMVFVFSGFIDNLTTTIVGIQITKRMFKDELRLIVGALLVIVANAGGAFSPIGDVTTLMIWFAKKYTADTIIFQGFLPSVALTLVASWIILRRVGVLPCTTDCAPLAVEIFRISRSSKLIIVATLASFMLPLLFAGIGLPAYMGLLVGLGMVWLLIDVLTHARPQQTHLQAKIKKFFQQTDLESIQFFIGILLAVGALHALGVLDILTSWMMGVAPGIGRTAVAFIGMGLSSAFIDNVPLTAAAISTLNGVPGFLWVLLALTVGTGGSVLIIGSAAGVIAMGMLPDLTFSKYIKIASGPALIGFFVAVGVWLIQYLLFFH